MKYARYFGFVITTENIIVVKHINPSESQPESRNQILNGCIHLYLHDEIGETSVGECGRRTALGINVSMNKRIRENKKIQYTFCSLFPISVPVCFIHIHNPNFSIGP